MSINGNSSNVTTLPLPLGACDASSSDSESEEGGAGRGSVSCIIVAGGRGLRMGGDQPKQFLPIGGRPVLMHTLEVFERAVPGIRLILVLPHDQQDRWSELCLQYAFTLPHTVVDGGETRYHSVCNGLQALAPLTAPQALSPLPPRRAASPLTPKSPSSTAAVPSAFPEGSQSLVAVHDGVRPLVSAAVIRRCFEAAREHGAAVPVVPVVETVRQLSPTPPQAPSPLTAHLTEGSLSPHSTTLDRSRLRLVQTPQVFSLDLLIRAYEQPYRDAFTDDASVVEALGHPITLVEGNRENIKITTPFDLTIAEALLVKKC